MALNFGATAGSALYVGNTAVTAAHLGNTQVWAPAGAQPQPTYLESWTGTDGAAWPAQWTTYTNGGAATPTIQGNQGKLEVATSATYTKGASAVLSGKTDARDFDYTFDVTLSSITEAYYYVTVRSTTPPANLDPSGGYWLAFFPHNGTTTMGIGRWGGGNVSGDLPNSGAWTAGVARRIRYQVIANDLKLKFWNPGQAEPTAWFWEGSNSDISANTGKFHIQTLSGAGTAAKHMLIDNLVDNLAA